MKKIFKGVEGSYWENKEKKDRETIRKNIDGKDREIIQEHWSRSAVFTDVWDLENLPDEQFLPEEELQKGEVWAVSHQVGCYIVRRALRIYKVADPGYNLEAEKPAEKEDLELLRATHGGGGKAEHPFWMGSDLREKLRDTMEISARHISDPDGAFIYITRAASHRNYYWSESIKSICTVKENAQIPDKYASLLVCMAWVGDSHSSDTWYKLEPTGKLAKLTAGIGGVEEDNGWR